MKAITLDFQPPAVACKWPAGSVVAAVQIQRGRPVWETFAVHSYHRPDWIDENNDNYSLHFAGYTYALLERRAKRKE